VEESVPLDEEQRRRGMDAAEYSMLLLTLQRKQRDISKEN
jgi:hypothetical protein